LFDSEAGLEQAARRFVAKIMEVEVNDLQIFARTLKRCAS
jgi:hypothetical protein